VTKYAMVIDLHRCSGCSACIIACKSENNLQEGVAWSSKITRTVGKFPNVNYYYLPTLCNHCDNAPCVKGCPTSAMHKDENGLTVHDPDKCIGCRYCMARCPYGAISFNWEEPHQSWQDEIPLIEGVTASAKEMVDNTGGNALPYYNPEGDETYARVRPKGVVEKCNFCNHRVQNGELPYCVEACPANARIFGDLDDPESDVSKILGQFQAFRLREELGTEPRVFYVRGFNPGTYESTKGEI